MSPPSLPSRLAARLKIRHLNLLLAVRRHGTLTRVAVETGISQPAATKALAEIEDIFGAPLFTRSRHGLEPTPLGQLALVRARHLLQDLDQWTREVDALRSGHSAHLNIGAIPFVSGPLLARAVALLHQRHGVTVTLHRATTDQLLELLLRRDLDCVIGRAAGGGPDPRAIWHEMLYRQWPALIGHPRLVRRLPHGPPDWSELASMRWILPSPATPIGGMIAGLFVRAQVQPPTPMIETYSLDVIESLIMGDDRLVSIVPEDIAREMALHGRVAMAPWRFDWELPPMSLIRRVRDVPLQAETHFAQILRELCADGGVQTTPVQQYPTSGARPAPHDPLPT